MHWRKVMHGVPVGHRGHMARLDKDDVEWAMQYNWHLSRKDHRRTWYARTNIRLAPGKGKGSRTIMQMHRGLAVRMGILEPGSKLEVDHVNHDGLDNRRLNLRVVNVSGQRTNTEKYRGAYSSIYKGVCWDCSAGKWKVYCNIDGKQVTICRCDDELEAAMVYDDFARISYGENACTNFGGHGPSRPS